MKHRLITVNYSINCYIPICKLFFLLLQILGLFNNDAVFVHDFRFSETRTGLSVIYCDFVLIMCANYMSRMALTLEAENH